MLLSLPGVANGTGNLLAAAKRAALGVSRGEMVPGGPADSYPRDAIRVDHKSRRLCCLGGPRASGLGNSDLAEQYRLIILSRSSPCGVALAG